MPSLLGNLALLDSLGLGAGHGLPAGGYHHFTYINRIAFTEQVPLPEIDGVLVVLELIFHNPAGSLLGALPEQVSLSSQARLGQ